VGKVQADRTSRIPSRVRPSEVRTFALLAIASALNPGLAVDAETAATVLRTTPGNVRRLRKRGQLEAKEATGRGGYVFPLAAILALKPHLRPKRRRSKPAAGGAITPEPEHLPASGKEGELP
jgi:hypothetical protein